MGVEYQPRVKDVSLILTNISYGGCRIRIVSETRLRSVRALAEAGGDCWRNSSPSAVNKAVACEKLRLQELLLCILTACLLMSLLHYRGTIEYKTYGSFSSVTTMPGLGPSISSINVSQLNKAFDYFCLFGNFNPSSELLLSAKYVTHDVGFLDFSKVRPSCIVNLELSSQTT